MDELRPFGRPHWEQDVTTYLTIGGQRRLITSSPVFATWQKHLTAGTSYWTTCPSSSVLRVRGRTEAIDEIMTKLRTLVAETGICLFLVSHLRRSQGKAHEDGAQISLGELRGSQAIAQLSDIVIGMERDQQHENEDVRNTTTQSRVEEQVHRETGPACWLAYDRSTGRLSEVANPHIGDDF